MSGKPNKLHIARSLATTVQFDLFYVGDSLVSPKVRSLSSNLPLTVPTGNDTKVHCHLSVRLHWFRICNSYHAITDHSFISMPAESNCMHALAILPNTRISHLDYAWSAGVPLIIYRMCHTIHLTILRAQTTECRHFGTSNHVRNLLSVYKCQQF